MSTLDQILKRMDDTAVSEKTASANPPEPSASPSPSDAVLAAVRSVGTKTASAPAPVVSGDAVAALQGLAEKTAAAEEEMLLKQAHAYGAAICDGFAHRLAQYDAALPAQAKTASAGIDQETLEKVAQAAYFKGAADMEKTAEAKFQEGYNAQVAEIHKIAAHLHYAGQQDARTIATAGGPSVAHPFGGEKVAYTLGDIGMSTALGAGLGGLGGYYGSDEDQRLSGMARGAGIGAAGGALLPLSLAAAHASGVPRAAYPLTIAGHGALSGAVGAGLGAKKSPKHEEKLQETKAAAAEDVPMAARFNAGYAGFDAAPGRGLEALGKGWIGNVAGLGLGTGVGALGGAALGGLGALALRQNPAMGATIGGTLGGFGGGIYGLQRGGATALADMYGPEGALPRPAAK